MSLGKDLRILMLEDDPTDAELIQRSLRGQIGNPRFQVVANAMDYALALEKFHPDVILADNSLPQFDATDALQYLHDKGYFIPFIMVTGTMSEEFAVAILKKGADDYVLKSSLVRLPSAINAALRHHETEMARERAISQLVISERNYRNLVERITDAFIALDKDWRYTFINRQAAVLIRRAPHEVLGKSVWDIFPEAVGSATYHAMQKAMREQRYQSNTDYFAPLDLWQENHIYPSEDGLSMFIRNISERIKLEKELVEQKRKEQVRITATALAAQEKERNAIAVELHDNVNQILVGTNLMLTIIRDRPEKLGELLPACMDSIGQAISENRKIAHELVSPNLETDSLISQLERLKVNMLSPVGIEVRVEQEPLMENLLSPEQKLALYRIFQEQCANIVKYAQASEVLFLLEKKGEHFHIKILDNGKGAALTDMHKGIGLSNIAARLHIYDGRMEVWTAPDEGFCLDLYLPLKQD